LGGLPGMSTGHLIVAGRIGDVCMVVFVGSHPGAPAEIAGSKNGGDDQRLSGQDRGGRVSSALAGGNRGGELEENRTLQ
jgi:hypothetical protein